MVHEALIYSEDEQFVEVAVPFLGEAIAAGDDAVAILRPNRAAQLREALGPDAAAVSFFDADEWFRSPGPLLLFSRGSNSCDLRPGARCIGEIPFGEDRAAAERWLRFESLVNRVAGDAPVWGVCAYDTRRLADELVEGARRTHPIVSTAGSRVPSAEHFAAGELGAPLVPRVARSGVEEEAAVGMSPGSDPLDLRRAVVWGARRAGLSCHVIEDLLLAMSALLSEVFDAGRSTATVRTARAGGEWLCELVTTGRGRKGLPLDEGCIGLVVARVICDRIEIADDERGLLVRLVFGSPRTDARQRILTAAADLFAERGVRETGVNAVIARAGVAKATFYAHFASKHDLVSTWLRSPRVQWLDGVKAEVAARAPSPRDRPAAFFEVLGEWLEAEGFAGCQILNAAIETRGTDDAARLALGDLQQDLEGYFRSATAEAGLPDPDRLASQLLLLVPGTIAIATARRSGGAAARAKDAATRLVDASST